jgi:hypothetical protein
VVCVHRGAHTGGIRLAFVTTRSPLGFVAHEFIVNPSTIYADWQVVEHVILSLTSAVLAYIFSVSPNLDFG